MNASFNLELSPRPNKEGLHSVYIRITIDRKHNRAKTSVLIDKKHFNKSADHGKWIRKTHASYRQLNDTLSDLLENARLSYTQLDSPRNRQEVIDTVLNKKSGISLEEYFNQELAVVVEKHSIYHYTQMKLVCSLFIRFCSPGILLKEVTSDLLQSFESSLKIKATSKRAYFKHLSYLFKLAVKKDLLIRNPFDHFVLPKPSPIFKARLMDSEIENLRTPVPISSNRYNERTAFWDEISIDLYLISYFQAGIRIGDLIQLRVKSFNDGRLTYVMNKTGKIKSVPIRKEAVPILEKYHKKDARPLDYYFPILDSNAPYAKALTPEEKNLLSFDHKMHLKRSIHYASSTINDSLKNRAKRNNIDKKITFHTSRHSFADKARRMMKSNPKITLDSLRLMLGHSDFETTQRYLNSLDFEGQDEAFDAIFDYNNENIE